MGNDAYIAEVPNLRWKGAKVGKRAYRSRLEILWLMFDGLGESSVSQKDHRLRHTVICVTTRIWPTYLRTRLRSNSGAFWRRSNSVRTSELETSWFWNTYIRHNESGNGDFVAYCGRYTDLRWQAPVKFVFITRASLTLRLGVSISKFS